MPEVENIYKHELLDIMRGWSERHYAAGWNRGLEYELWSCIQDVHLFGFIEASEILAIAQVALLANGWWVWDEAAKTEKFVSLEEWERIRERP